MTRGATMYNKSGKIRDTGKDICDCFDADCKGCHFKCEKCGSQKCCIECRSLRNWCYQDIEREGDDKLKKNPLCLKEITKKK